MNQTNDVCKEIDINDYKKGKRMGKNGLSVSYLIEQKETSNNYVAKIIDCEDNSETVNQIVQQKLNSIIQNDHPTIVKIIGYSKKDLQDENNFTFIMENSKFGSLLNLFKDNNNSINNTNRQIIIAGITKGMLLLHNRKFIHHDLKATNILLNEKNQPIITDYYLKDIIDFKQSPNEIRYQAPEIIKNEKLTEKIDVYAFGILMYEIIYNTFAYPELEKGEISDLDFKNKVTKENYRPKFTKNISKDLQNLIEDCWSPDPNKRPTFEEIYNKFAFINETNANGYLLDDVDINLYNDYISIISDPNEKNNRIAKFEEENCQLKKENQKLREEIIELKELNKQNLSKISKIEKDYQTLQKGNSFLKEQSEEHYKTIFKFKEETKKAKSGNDVLREENEEYSKMIQSYINKNQQLTFLTDLTNQIIQNLTILNFNSLPLKSQLYICNIMIDSPTDEIKQFFINLSGLIRYLLPFFNFDDPCIEICMNSEDLLKKVTKTSIIQLNSCATKCIFESNSLDLPSLLKIINNYTGFIFEIEYPTGSYQFIFNEVKKIKEMENNKEKIKIALNIVQPRNSQIDKLFGKPFEIIPKFENDTSISYVKGDITNGSFKYCTSLMKVTINSFVNIIEKNIFEGCSSLTQISIPSSVTTIGDYAFYECTSLKQITIPNSVIKIGDFSFTRCTSLTQISIPSSVTSISDYTFRRCTSLVNVTIPSSVTSIGNYAFSDCSSLVQILIPSSVIAIGEHAFESCTSLEQISIPFSVEEIGGFAFTGCSSLLQILAPSHLNIDEIGLDQKVQIVKH